MAVLYIEIFSHPELCAANINGGLYVLTEVDLWRANGGNVALIFLSFTFDAHSS